MDRVFEISMNEITVDDSLNLRQESGDLEGLRESIRQIGLTDPVTIRCLEDGGYTMVKGYRRRQACEDLGMKKIRCLVLPDETSLVDALLLNFMENVVRVNLNPMEEAEGVKRLLDEGMTKEEIVAKIGWTKALFTQRYKLLSYTLAIQGALRDNRISVVQAGLIAQLPEEEHERFVELAQRLMVSDLRKKIEKLLAKEEAEEKVTLDSTSSDETVEASEEELEVEDEEERTEQAKHASNVIKRVFKSFAKKLELTDLAKSIDVSVCSNESLEAMSLLLENMAEYVKKVEKGS